MQTTISLRVSKRKATKEWFWELQGLAEFANLGDSFDDLQQFRGDRRRFFPDDLTKWIYRNAELWMTLSNLPDRQPDNYRETLRGIHPAVDSPMTPEAWAGMAGELRDKLRFCRPPLLWYRALLRAVWRREDPDGSCLRHLLGFDADCIPFPGEEDTKLKPLSLFMWKEHPEKELPARVQKRRNLNRRRLTVVLINPLVSEASRRRAAMNLTGNTAYTDDTQAKTVCCSDDSREPIFTFLRAWQQPQTVTIKPMTFEIEQKETEERDTFAGLPYGTPVVDGNTGIITWSFGCPLQRAVYDLMRDRWRAMICPNCGKYFVADKTAQRYCSPECYREEKGMKALDYWNRIGRAARQAKALRAKSQRRKS